MTVDIGRYIAQERASQAHGSNWRALAFQELQNAINQIKPTVVTQKVTTTTATSGAVIPTGATTPPAGPSTKLSVNGAALNQNSQNLNDALPPAPTGSLNVHWLIDNTLNPPNVSGSVVSPTLVPTAATVDTGPVTTNQTGNLQVSGGIAPAGLYKVQVYMEVTIANTAGSLDISIGWQDDVAARTATNGTNGMPADISTAATNFAQGSTVIRADGVHNLTYTFTVTQTTGTATYRGFVVLVRFE